MKLENKVIAVTGGANGIGRATAEHLRDAGAHVVIGDVDASAVSAAAAEMGVGGKHLDVTDEESFTAFVDEIVAEHGHIDVLVNNAGIMPVGPFLDFSETVVRRNFEVDLFGVVRGTRLAAQAMLPNGSGHIVNVASVAGLVPLAGQSIYSAAKAGVIAFSEAVAAELRPHGIKVLTVLPNFTRTALISGLNASRFIPVGDTNAVARAITKAIAKERPRTIIPSWTATSYFWVVTPRFMKRLYDRMFHLNEVFMSYDDGARAAYQSRLEKG